MIIDLESPDTWPMPLTDYLDQHHDLFLSWEMQAEGAVGRKVSGFEYDQAICGLRCVMQPYSLVGLHCTRLTEQEIADIAADGMQLPNGDMLQRRVGQLVASGLVSESIGTKLLARNQADEHGRAGMVWFWKCPFRTI